MHHLLAQAAPPDGGSSLIANLVPILLMFAVVWFVVLRPQRKQEKERQARVAALKKGDRVRTRGGIVAPVVRVKDDEVVLGIGGDRSVELVVHKAFVDEVYGAKPAAESK